MGNTVDSHTRQPSQQPMNSVASWLHNCDEKHEECKQPFDADFKARFAHKPLPPLAFRRLDLHLGCVKEVSLDERYAALSYVASGQPTSYSSHLNRSSLENAAVEGWLQKIQPSLPKTISDAVNFVKALVERYLWMDALCFAYDAKQDRAYCKRMTSVYRGSYFTLVAASGDGANAGMASAAIEDAPTDPAKAHDINWYLSRSAYHKGTGLWGSSSFHAES